MTGSAWLDVLIWVSAALVYALVAYEVMERFSVLVQDPSVTGARRRAAGVAASMFWCWPVLVVLSPVVYVIDRWPQIRRNFDAARGR